MLAAGPTPIAKLAPLDAYCQQRGPNLAFCGANGSCMPRSLMHKCAAAPYEASPAVPSIGACLLDKMAYCTNYPMNEEVLACQNGASYSQRPRTLIDEASFQSLALFPAAFLDGMWRGGGCRAVTLQPY